MIWRIATLTFVGISAGMVGSWLADRDVPTVVVATKVINPVVKPGGTLFIDYEVHRTRSCAVEINRLLFDSTNARFPLDDLKFALAPGRLGDDRYRSPLALPNDMAAGEAHYRTISTYRCNVLHTLWPIIIAGPSIEFEVKP